MTGPQRSPGARRLGGEVHRIRSAAAVEAAALGHPEIDVDHLLLGLLVAGGPSARVLAAHGVGAAALRRAVADLQEQDLLGLGAVAAAPQPAAVRASDRGSAGALPLGGRAQALLDDAPLLGDDLALLRAVLDDGGRRAERLLAHLDVDVDALRAQLAAEPDVDGALSPAMPGADTDVDWSAADRALEARRDPVPAGTTWMSAARTQLVPAPADQVWALISDPQRRPQWDAACLSATVDADGVERITGHDGDVVEQTAVDVEPGQRIGWLQRGPDGGAAPRVVVQIALTAQGASTVVRLRQDWPARGRATGRLSRWILTRMIGAKLRTQANGIARAAG